jgi:hypothetical protein
MQEPIPTCKGVNKVRQAVESSLRWLDHGNMICYICRDRVVESSDLLRIVD